MSIIDMHHFYYKINQLSIIMTKLRIILTVNTLAIYPSSPFILLKKVEKNYYLYD